MNLINGMELCGGFKENGPHRTIERGTIRRYGLVRVGVAFGASSEVSDGQAHTQWDSLFLLPAIQM